MGIWSKIAGMVAPSVPKARAYFENAYEGARNRRRLANWQPSRASINQQLSLDGYVLRARARDLVRNNGYAASACESFVGALVGSGIKPSVLLSNAAQKDALQKLWREWTDEADFDGVTDFYGLQALVARAMFESGECFIRFMPADPDSGLAVPLQVQLLESEMLEYGRTNIAENGNWIVNGVEVDTFGRRVAYHFWSTYPGEVLYQREAPRYVRVPADEVLHIFRVLRPKQMRGVPWITPAVVKLWNLDAFDDAELDRKKLAAMYAGFITSPAPEELFGDDDPDAPRDPSFDPDIPTLEPGTMQSLQPGEDVKFSNPAEVGGSYEPFQFRQLTAVSAALGVPYSHMTGDWSKANYSSERGALIEFRGRIEQLQHAGMIFQMCRPIWKRWVSTAALSGAIDLPGFAVSARPFHVVKWIAPRFDWIDPLHDLQAEKLAVDNGFKSRSDVVEAGGVDPEENDRRIAADQERERLLKIVLPGVGNGNGDTPGALPKNPGAGGAAGATDDDGQAPKAPART